MRLLPPDGFAFVDFKQYSLPYHFYEESVSLVDSKQ